MWVSLLVISQACKVLRKEIPFQNVGVTLPNYCDESICLTQKGRGRYNEDIEHFYVTNSNIIKNLNDLLFHLLICLLYFEI